MNTLHKTMLQGMLVSMSDDELLNTVNEVTDMVNTQLEQRKINALLVVNIYA